MLLPTSAYTFIRKATVMLVAFRMNVYALVGSNIVFALIMCILNQLKIRKVCGYKINIRHMFLKPFIAAAVMGVVTYIIWFVLDLLIGGRVIPTVIAICVAIVVYIVLILKMGTLSEEDILSLPLGGKLLRYSRKFHLVPEAGDSDEDITE